MITESRVIDLGLPSGTLWADKNEEGYYTFDEAVEKYGDQLPTHEQLEELKNSCKWEWIGDGYRVEGPNGNVIVMPAAGSRSCCGNVGYVGSDGDYWSSTPYGLDDAWYLAFGSGGVDMFCSIRCYNFSVRLVK